MAEPPQPEKQHRPRLSTASRISLGFTLLLIALAVVTLLFPG